MRPGNSKTLASTERGGPGKVLSRLRRVEDVPPTRWWKRLPQQVASPVSAVRAKRDRPGAKTRSGASTRRTAALAALGLATAGAIALTLRRRRAEEGPPTMPVPTGAPAADEASETAA
jgi:hypothetical protein